MSVPVTVFRPVGATVTRAVTTTSANVARTAFGFSNEPCRIRVANVGSVVAFVEFGGNAVAATVAASIPILPNTVEIFEIRGDETHVAAITASSTATVYLTTGTP